MNQKVCLLTGATSGIGQAAAIALAEQGYTLYLVARSEDKARATEQRIKSSAANANINWLFGDLAKLDDVRAIASNFLATGSPLDLLFNNAGVTYNNKALTVDGYEMMFAVNHLAPFLLTHLLIDKLCEGEGETRVVTTSSGAHNFVDKIELEDINWDAGFKTFPAYGNSKLANILFTRSLATRLQQQAPNKVFSVNCFHPGFVGTSLGTQTLFGKIVMTLIRPFARSSAKGAETGLFLATDPSVSGSNAGYYYNCQLKSVKAHAKDDADADALWEKSLQLTGLAGA